MKSNDHHISSLNIKSSQLKSCCTVTIDRLAECNPMMICQQCEYLIKCFVDEVAYKNYVKFCESQKREIVQDSYKDYRVVSFPKQ